MPARPTKPNGTRSRRLTPKPPTPPRPISRRLPASLSTKASSGWRRGEGLEGAALPARQKPDRFLREAGAIGFDHRGNPVLEVGPGIGGGEQDLRRLAGDRAALRVAPLPGAIEHREPVREVRRDYLRHETAPFGLAERRASGGVAAPEPLGHQPRL